MERTLQLQTTAAIERRANRIVEFVKEYGFTVEEAKEMAGPSSFGPSSVARVDRLVAEQLGE